MKFIEPPNLPSVRREKGNFGPKADVVVIVLFFFFQAEDGIRDDLVTGVQTCALPISDGRFLRASDHENPDLYWGLRGGGGNFGVVTSIEYPLHDMDPVILGGNIVWPPAQAPELLPHYRHIAAAPPHAVHLAPFLDSEHAVPVLQIGGCWSRH